MNTEMTMNGTKALTMPTDMSTSWGAEGVDLSDILIPKLLMMQGLSELVAEEKAQMGDIVNSVTGEMLGTAREKDRAPVTIIPFSTFKTWIEFEKIGDKREFLRIIPFDSTLLPEGEGTGEQKGKVISRDRAINFHALLKNGDGSLQSLPYVICFKRTSYRAGMKLSTHFTTAGLAKDKTGKPIPPAATMWNLCGKKAQNDDGTFYVFELEKAGDTSEQDLRAAYEWWTTLRTNNNIRVDNSDLKKDSEAHTSEASDVVDDKRF